MNKVVVGNNIRTENKLSSNLREIVRDLAVHNFYRGLFEPGTEEYGLLDNLIRGEDLYARLAASVNAYYGNHGHKVDIKKDFSDLVSAIKGYVPQGLMASEDRYDFLKGDTPENVLENLNKENDPWEVLRHFGSLMFMERDYIAHRLGEDKMDETYRSRQINLAGEMVVSPNLDIHDRVADMCAYLNGMNPMYYNFNVSMHSPGVPLESFSAVSTSK